MLWFDVRLAHPVTSTLSLHDALPISTNAELLDALAEDFIAHKYDVKHLMRSIMNSATYQRSSQPSPEFMMERSEEHTSELQSHSDLVCRLLLEKNNSYR